MHAVPGEPTSGLLLHPASSPGRWGIDDLGAGARRFAAGVSPHGPCRTGPRRAGEDPRAAWSDDA